MKLTFPRVRLAFPQLWDAKAFEPGSDEKFGATLLYEPDGPVHQAIKKAISTLLTEKHGDKAAAKFKAYNAAGKVWVLQDGEAKPQYAGFPGMMYLSPSTKERPRVVKRIGSNADGTGIYEPLLPADGKPYAGCYVGAVVEIYEYKTAGGGITSELKGIVFAEDGERLSGGGVAEDDDFEAIPVAVVEEGGDELETSPASDDIFG